MSTHDAKGSMLGYLYQVRNALCLLLQKDNTSAQISIEKFDDIAFEDNGTPLDLIQVKHHIKKTGSLSDKSVDLWRTLKVWIDLITNDHTLLDITNFVIITTSRIQEESAVDMIVNGKYDLAYDRLKTIASDNSSQSNALYYETFLSTNEEYVKSLISHIVIISSASNIADVLNDIKKTIRYSCRPQHIDVVTERVEGWWTQEVIKALLSDNAVIMSYRQLNDKIFEISRQYDDDNLPIEFWNIDQVNENDLDPKDRVFINQLRLIQSSSRALEIAIQDYYRASKQRSSWIRQGLLYANELDNYERRLKEAWNRAFAEMEEKLMEYDEPSNHEKAKAGKDLYHKISDLDIRIRNKCDEPYVMHGTYHILANSLQVGWHIDFLSELKCLLEGS